MRPPTRVESMSGSALEAEVFRFESSYFCAIGLDHQDVAEFRRFIRQRDLHELRLNWGRLSESFVRLEAVAGRRGRPLIMDYYFGYEEALVELCKREIQGMSTPALEDAVFRFEDMYFDQLPRNDAHVEEFRVLVQQRDLPGLRQRWASLLDAFLRLESAAGALLSHRFQRVYFLQFEMLVELCRRRDA